MNSLEVVLLAAVVVFAAMAGLFAWKLHRAGVPNDQLGRQVALKGGNLLDAVEERMAAALKAWADSHQATMNAAYFDRDDFMQQIGRLPPSYTQAIRLDAAVVRNGASPGVDYATQTNGNILVVAA